MVLIVKEEEWELMKLIVRYGLNCEEDDDGLGGQTELFFEGGFHFFWPLTIK